MNIANTSCSNTVNRYADLVSRYLAMMRVTSKKLMIDTNENQN